MGHRPRCEECVTEALAGSTTRIIMAHPAYEAASQNDWSYEYRCTLPLASSVPYRAASQCPHALCHNARLGLREPRALRALAPRSQNEPDA